VTKIFQQVKVILTNSNQWLVVILVFLATFLFFSSTFGYESGHFLLDSKQYSDFSVHMALIRSFSFNHNWPPQYPFFAGESIRYHYLFYLLVGLLERAGLTLPLAMNLLSSFGMTLLLVMIYKYSLLFFHRKSAGVLAVILFLFNGSFSFVRFFAEHDWNWSMLGAVIKAQHFLNFGPWNGDIVSAFWNLNIYTNQRHLALSFGVILWLFWYLVTATIRQTRLRSWQKLLLLIGFGFLPILHQAGALMLVGLCWGWLVWYWRRIDLTTKLWYLGCSAVLVGSFLWSVPFSIGGLEMAVGYLAPEKTLLGITHYWLMNLGLYLVILPFLLRWSRKKMGLFVFLSFGFFCLANFFRLSTDMINNHKLINFFMITLNIALAGFLVEGWRAGRWKRVLIIVIFPFFILSGVFDLFPILNDTQGQITDWSRREIGQWLIQNTGPDAQILTASYMYHPASMVGRILFLDYGYHSWSMGYDDHAKRQALPILFSPAIDRASWCQTAQSFKITHVVLGRQEKEVDGKIMVQDSALYYLWSAVFESSDGWRVWDVKKLCYTTPD